ncbi:glycosyltransferase family 2 protein, partial [Vibrio breoganii]|uniref:glycosyltransferase family 2 protein n=1 Tax=Vibrio breoganii TaxID=553239 RepID=UPI0018E4342D
MFFSRSDFIEVGGFDECFPAWQDYDLWIRLIKLKGKAYCTGTQTYIVDQSHVHERISGSKKKWDESLQLFEAKYALDKKYFVYWEISVLEEFKEVRIKDYFRFLLLTSDIK